MTWISDLHATLDQRVTPEVVAQLIQRSGIADGWVPELRLLLNRAASAYAPWWISSMSSDFERADDCAAQLAAVGRMFGVDVTHVRPDAPDDISALITGLGQRLGGWAPGSDWKADRLNRVGRRSAPYTVVARGLASKRQYNRHVRVLRHLWDKAQRMAAMQHQRKLILIGRSGFAARITVDQFAADPVTACFVAYYTARKNLRRQFALTGRGNALDELADALLTQAMRQGTDAEMLAWVFPRPAVLTRLTPAQLGRLLGDWHAVMTDTAAALERAWPGDEHVNRMTMIVRHGMDSSTWNTMASAYNAARSAWVNCVAASGALALLEPAIPGKVMRMMAADLAYWHHASGGDVDPNTLVWARLPLPWQVLSGTVRCTADDMRAACAEAGMDPLTTGWLAPLPDGAPAQFRPTPELVHGIAVADPAWAAVLRKGGAFSGKRIKDGYAANIAAMPPEIVTGPRPVYNHQGAYLGATTQEE